MNQWKYISMKDAMEWARSRGIANDGEGEDVCGDGYQFVIFADNSCVRCYSVDPSLPPSFKLCEAYAEGGD